MTASGLWSLGPTAKATRLYQIDIGSFSPSAMVRAADGSVYIGLRQYVLKLDRSNGSWRETWLTLAACLKVEMKDGICDCAR
ncbi:MAG TPA: hypothetical protein VFX12_07310 [Vicinamibacterales bacterium]|nr:hypothetical protein [Vicinamibacterales bacterium]